MSKSAELAAKAQRMREQRDTPTPDRSSSVPTERSSAVPTERKGRSAAAPAEVRVRPVRLTVDVTPADHAALSRWCLDAAEELGAARVHGQEILRALLRRALDDPALRAQIATDIQSARGQ